MAEETDGVEQGALPVSVGERLRTAREKLGLRLEDVSAQTRIGERHLGLIEAGDFGALPARAYAVGFARSYARLVGLNEQEITGEVRSLLAGMEGDDRVRARTFEPGDPARVPSAGLAWISALVGLAIFVAGSVFVWKSLIAPAGELPSLTQEEPARTAPPATRAPVAAASAAAPDVSGPVVFTALEDGIWVKFYDRAGTQLLQKQLSAGESYTVPPQADGPQIWTGRPDALSITIGGKAVPKLAETQQILKDVPITAAALLAREARPQTPSPTA